jgi:hypothetical protein
MKASTLAPTACLFLILAPATGFATQAPFIGVAAVTDGSGIPAVTASGNNFKDFTDEITESGGAFQPLTGHTYDANVNFLGVPNAMLFATNSTGTSVTVTLPPINFTQTFTGSSRSAVNSEIDDFFEKNGSGIFASFLKAIAQTSPIAVTDGNPNSATAIAANSVFFSNAMTPADQLADEASGTKPQFSGLAIGFDAGRFTAGGFSGGNYDLSFTALNVGLGDQVRLQMPVDFNYLTVDGAQVAGAGITLVLPIRLTAMDQNNPVSWTVSPLAGVSGRASIDLAGGVALWDAGIISSVAYKVNGKLVLCLMDQYTDNRSFAISDGSYSFNPLVNQGILKNGVRLVTPLSDRLILDCFAVETNFLNPAVVKNFATFGSSLTLRATKSFNLSLAGNYDTGPSFDSWSVSFQSAWHW